MRLLRSPVFKWIELILIFIGLPLMYYFNYIPFHKSIPLLTVFFLFFFILIKDKNFPSKKFGFNEFRNWETVVLRFLVFAAISLVAVLIFSRNIYLFCQGRE